MRRIIIAVFAAATLVAAPTHAQDAKADEILQAAREALGGQDKIASIKTIVATAKHRRTMGDMDVNGETEISVHLPDKYLRSQTDQLFGNSVTMEMGFNGGQVLRHSTSHGGGGAMIRMVGPGGNAPGADAMDPEAVKTAMLRAQRADFARLMLGFIATTPEYLEATFTYVGEAESPDGRADVIEIKGADDFAAKLFIDRQSRRPLMLTYMGVAPQVRMVRSGRSPQEPSPERRAEAVLRDAQRERREPIEMQVYFDDYRNVGGLWLPHRVSRAANGQTNEELEFQTIRVNDPIKPSTFDAK
jgi:hypothetical protein